jgi:hypothetical protein
MADQVYIKRNENLEYLHRWLCKGIFKSFSVSFARSGTYLGEHSQHKTILLTPHCIKQSWGANTHCSSHMLINFKNT